MIDAIKTGAAIGVVAVVAIALAFAINDCAGDDSGPSDRSNQLLERARIAEAQLSRYITALDTARDLYEVRARRDSERIAELERAVVQAEQEAAAADSAAAVSARSLRGALLSARSVSQSMEVEQLIDTALADLDSLEAREAREDSAQRRARDSLKTKVHTLQGQLARAEALVETCAKGLKQCQATVDTMSEAINSLESDLNPSLWDRIGGATPEVLAKGGVVALSCLVPKGENRLYACGGATGVVLVDLAL